MGVLTSMLRFVAAVFSPPALEFTVASSQSFGTATSYDFVFTPVAGKHYLAAWFWTTNSTLEQIPTASTFAGGANLANNAQRALDTQSGNTDPYHQGLLIQELKTVAAPTGTTTLRLAFGNSIYGLQCILVEVTNGTYGSLISQAFPWVTFSGVFTSTVSTTLPVNPVASQVTMTFVAYNDDSASANEAVPTSGMTQLIETGAAANNPRAFIQYGPADVSGTITVPRCATGYNLFSAVTLVMGVSPVVPAIVNQGNFGGRAPYGSPAGTTSWSLTAGNLVVITFQCRNPQTVPFGLSPALTGLNQRRVHGPTTFDNAYGYIYTGTVATSGTLTLTVDNTATSGDFWTARVVEISGGTYLAGNMAGAGSGIVPSVSLGPSSAMGSRGGLGFGFFLHAGAENFTVTSPTSLLSDSFPFTGNEFSTALGAETRAPGETTIATATMSPNGASFIYGWFQIENT